MWWILWGTWNIVILGFTVLPVENFVGHAHWDKVRWIPLYDHPLVLFDIDRKRCSVRSFWVPP